MSKRGRTCVAKLETSETEEKKVKYGKKITNWICQMDALSQDISSFKISLKKTKKIQIKNFILNIYR